MKLNLQFFGGRGSGGGRRMESSGSAESEPIGTVKTMGKDWEYKKTGENTWKAKHNGKLEKGTRTDADMNWVLKGKRTTGKENSATSSQKSLGFKETEKGLKVTKSDGSIDRIRDMASNVRNNVSKKTIKKGTNSNGDKYETIRTVNDYYGIGKKTAYRVTRDTTITQRGMGRTATTSRVVSVTPIKDNKKKKK